MMKGWGESKKEDDRDWLDEELENDEMDIGEFGFYMGYMGS